MSRRDRPGVPTPALTAVAVRALLLAQGRRLRGPRARRAAQPVRRARGQEGRETDLMAVDVKPDPQRARREPADRGPRAPAGPRHDADDLRRHRRPRAPQAAARALQPRARGRAARALQPDRRRAPRSCPTTTSATFARDVDREVLAPRAGRRRCSRACSGGCSYVGFSFDDLDGYAQLCGRLIEQLDEDGGGKLNRALYLVDRARVLPGHRQGAAAAPGSTTTPTSTSRCIIEKPFGTDLESARELQRVVSSTLPRAAGLPDRPLPGQGDRPERDGVPVRELHVRAGLEPQLHRPHPDHRGRGPRHRLPRRLLRPGGRAARPRPEPHAAAADARLHGAAGVLRGRQGARREGQGAAGDHAADARGGPARHRARAVQRRASRAARRSSATSRRTACPRARAPRPTSALRLEVHNWRWAGVPIFLRTGKHLARKVTEIAVQLKPVPHLAFQSQRLGRRAAQPARPHHAAQRGRLAVARGEDPRLERCASAR